MELSIKLDQLKSIVKKCKCNESYLLYLHILLCGLILFLTFAKFDQNCWCIECSFGKLIELYNNKNIKTMVQGSCFLLFLNHSSMLGIFFASRIKIKIKGEKPD